MAIDPSTGQPVIGTPAPDPVAAAQAQAFALEQQAAAARALADQAAADQAAAEKAAKPTVEEQIVADAVQIVNTVEGAVSNPKVLVAAILGVATPIAGMGASLGFITSTTSQAIVSATTVLVPAFAGLVAAIVSHGRANVKAATIRAGAPGPGASA